jgi:hypothetical protein
VNYKYHNDIVKLFYANKIIQILREDKL